MNGGQAGKLLRQLRQLLEPAAARECEDSDLLGRFAGTRDEAAFTALVRKHGPLVWRVCRRVLDHDHDAEDAFQGTFLVLARKAGSIRKHTSVASWLYGVAYRVAHKAKVAAARRRKHESRAGPMPAANPRGADRQADIPAEMAWRELQAMLDEELMRLPEKYRAPFVLCCLDSKSKKEAAQDLGWKEGTVSSRLAMARKLLQQRLARRGVMLSALLSGTALAQDTAAAMPLALGAVAVRAALAFAAGRAEGVSAMAVELATAVLHAMTAVRLKVGVVLLMLVSLAGTSAWAVRQTEPDATPTIAPINTNKGFKPGSPATAVAPILKPSSRDVDGQMTVTGQVLGADGRPLGQAKVTIVANAFRQPGKRGPEMTKEILASGQTNARGEFRLALIRPSVLRYSSVRLIAAAGGHALRSYPLPRGDDRLVCELKRGQVIRGRLVDEHGKPAAGVKVRVGGIVQRGNGGSVMRYGEVAEGLAGWLAPVLTNKLGEFSFTDVAENCEFDFVIRDDRFASQWLVLTPDPKGRAEPVTFTLQPRRTLEGRVICADSGRSLAHAHVLVMSTGAGAGPVLGTFEADADDQGRFRAAPFPGVELNVTVYPPRGEPYLVVQRSLRWPAGKKTQKIDVPLRRGVPVRGRIVETSTSLPVANATVDYEPRAEDNRSARHENGTFSSWWLQDSRSGKDGHFELVVHPGPGWLLVKSPTQDYIHVPVSARQLECGKRGGILYFPDALVPVDLHPGTLVHEVAAPLRRGVTVSGSVLLHDGSPAKSAFLLAPTYLPKLSALRGNALPMRLPATNGRFELPGCDPERSTTVLFFDTDRLEGAVVVLPGKRTEAAPARLAPCGSATARFVDRNGRPIANPKVWLDALLRPGADLQESIVKEVDACVTVPVQRLWGSPCVIENGRNGVLTFTQLIPGATYLVQADEGNGVVRKATIVVRPGEKLSIPDIVLHTPNPAKI